MDDSDTSSLSSALSSAPPSDDERIKIAPIFLKAKAKGKQSDQKPTQKPRKKTKPTEPPASPPRPPRSPSPPHDESLADNPDIAFLVMFRSRFSAAFPPKLAHLGPQDIERGVDGPTVSPQVENLLCALLGIVLNRKKPVEQGHYGRALEEAMSSQRSQWPRSWSGQNPLRGDRSFNTMSTSERLNLLRTLVMWSLSSSEIISQTIKDSYKQSRHEDDLNQPLSVQPWGVDGDKRRYWLIEGQDDTSFRLYRENAKSQPDVTWWNVGGSIDELKALAERLDTKDTTQAARRLSSRIIAAVPRFEATDEKRRRREYRQMRRAQFARPEPGFSLYEGRTRGKRMRYTFDDDEDFDESDFSVRRSGRHSDRSTPAEARGPVVTASGRHVRSREGGMYGESLLSGQSNTADTPTTNDNDGSEASGPAGATARASRQAARNGIADGLRKRKFNEIYNGADQMSDDDDDDDDGASSGGWNSADNEDDGEQERSEDEEMLSNAGDSSDDEEPSSLVVKLKVPKLDPLKDDLEARRDGSGNEAHALSNGILEKDPTEDKPPNMTAGRVQGADGAESGPSQTGAGGSLSVNAALNTNSTKAGSPLAGHDEAEKARVNGIKDLVGNSSNEPPADHQDSARNTTVHSNLPAPVAVDG
ncbi:hypothetical protein K461DRAFT_251531 [Myriangium duriaei CBS 260.36]|uniref:WHIM1 domain-containing protein n=1 Tax=Myriangium duriaei CBS 260.36 TaxID=1168546 RepID=A0A9P4JEP2_9PEZI|nr:hypothetical protein K461DRAFT_251531 [Myriangium duriaei CBS 260.36]